MSGKTRGQETEVANAQAYFLREGEPVTGHLVKNDKDQWCTVLAVNCARCGGAGGSDRWVRTGYTCFACGGAKTFEKTFRVYTADELAVLNERRDKRRAKVAEKRAKATAERKARVAAERNEHYAAFSEEYPDVIAFLDSEAHTERGGTFLSEMSGRLAEHGYLTGKQRDAVRAVEAKRAYQGWLRQQARHLWQTGERVEAEVVWERVIHLPSNNYLYGDSYIHIGKHEGATVVYKGSRSLVPWRRSRHDRDHYYPVLPYVTSVRATVTSHDVYNDVPQTRLARPKVLSDYDPQPRSETE